MILKTFDLRSPKSLLYVFIILGTATGCGVYSMSGIAIDYAKIQTITIDNFYDETAGAPPNIAQQFTEELRDYYQQNTQLTLEDAQGDLQLQGSVVNYGITPVARTAAEDPNRPDVAEAQRLTITVSVTYINTIEQEKSFENRRFSFYDDYNPQTQDLSSVEDELMATIFEQIIYDIFNATVADW